jgi:hypothetical protein
MTPATQFMVWWRVRGVVLWGGVEREREKRNAPLSRCSRIRGTRNKKGGGPEKRGKKQYRLQKSLLGFSFYAVNEH